MEKQLSQTKRRVGVLLSYLSLIVVVLLFEYCTKNDWNLTFSIIEIALLAIFISSFIITFIKTGLWQFSHKKIKNLDEREIIVTSKSLRISYSIFTIIAVFLIFILGITNLSISVVAAASLLIIAHILPASIIAWNSKDRGQ